MRAQDLQKQSPSYRLYDVGGYRVELLKRPGRPVYWQFRVYCSDSGEWQFIESGWLGSRDEAASVAGMVIADHRREQ